MDGSAARLVAWFGEVQRQLPWREPYPRDPYRVLVSEVMLQQTQVDRVIGPYLRFLARFPTVERLAAAATEDVVHAFSGLGYYQRARRLHAAAQAVVERGAWPQTRYELAHLPGIGAYTSAAVAAFCFAGSDPPVDGNVARVTARVLALPWTMGSSALQRDAERFARRLHEKHPSPVVWEALMELGARLCTPRRPRCVPCPLRHTCRARCGQPLLHPAPRPRPSRRDVVWVVLWLERYDGHVLLHRIKGDGLLHGLWLPPFAVLGGAEASETARTLAVSTGHAVPLRAAGRVEHCMTHHRIAVLPFAGTVTAGQLGEGSGDHLWDDPLEPLVPTSGLLVKLHAACAGATADSTVPTFKEA